MIPFPANRVGSSRAIRARLHANLSQNPDKVYNTLYGYFMEALFDENHPASYIELLNFYDQEWQKWAVAFRNKGIAVDKKRLIKELRPAVMP